MKSFLFSVEYKSEGLFNMVKRNRIINVLLTLEVLILLIISVNGILSFDSSQSFFTTNIYGQSIELFGNGVYFYDSYFKAPIFIGTDFSILVLVIPIIIMCLIWFNQKPSNKSRLALISILGVVFYYSLSISTGVTYNYLFLFYLFSVMLSWLGIYILIRELNIDQLNLRSSKKFYLVFLIISGVALFSIWLMDIIPTLLLNKPLMLIETYTTEVTYVYDMAFISPMMFLSYYLIKKNDGVGVILLSCMLVLCTIIGIMLPIQTIFQLMANIIIPIPVLVIKVGVFVMLAFFSGILTFNLFREIE